MKDPSLGYARTFVRQVEDCLGLALERGVRIVSNAGGLNPAGLAERLREVARGLGLDPAIAHVEGDDLRPVAAELGLGREGAHRQRLPRRLRDRRRPPGRGGRRGDRPGHRRLAGGGGGGGAPRLVPDVVRRARGRDGRGSRARVRVPGDRRQLLGVPRAVSAGSLAGDRPMGFPVAEIARRRVERDHQARGHRRRGHGRHRDRAAGLRDPVDALPRPRRHHAPGHDRARAGRAGPGRDPGRRR